MRKIIKKIILGAVLLLFLNSPLSAAEIAIIVNRQNPVNDLSSGELTRIFKAERQYWDGDKILLLMRESASWEKEVILKKVYSMSNEELDKFWLGKIFRGEVISFPAVFGSDDMVKKLINTKAGIISFIDSKAADASVKVLKIDGKLPGERNYPLSR